VEHEYDIFEELPEGSPVWRGHASGLQNLRVKLMEVASATNNRCFAMHIGTQEIIARLNASSSPRTVTKRVVFQIAYDHGLASDRTALLRKRGYDVVTVMGNESAKLILSVPQHFDLFLVDCAAPEVDREVIVAWLKKYYPNTRVLALNPPKQPVLPGADYNVKLNGPDAWLSAISHAFSS
jgi:hypothetical protein